MRITDAHKEQKKQDKYRKEKRKLKLFVMRAAFLIASLYVIAQIYKFLKFLITNG